MTFLSSNSVWVQKCSDVSEFSYKLLSCFDDILEIMLSSGSLRQLFTK